MTEDNETLAADRRDVDAFALWNETDAPEIKPQARSGMVFNDEDWHNDETAPAGVGFRGQVEKLTVRTTKNGATEFKVRFRDVSGGEFDGRMLNVKSYLSNKVDEDTGRPKDTTIEYNKRTRDDLMVLGLTADFMRTQPSFEMIGQLVSDKAAVVEVFPYWEFDSEGKAWPKLDSYWEALADETQTDLDDLELDDDEEF